MPNMTMPSEKQADLLERLGVWVPSSRAVAARLIDYVMHGNGTGGNQTVRLGYAKHFHADWTGKRVKSKSGVNQTGTVKRVMPRSPREIFNIKQQHPNLRAVAPFIILVDWDDKTRRPSYSSPSRLTVIDNEEAHAS